MIGLGAAGVLAVLVVAALLLTPERLSGVAAAVQAVAVVPLLGIGVVTLLRDNAEKRADRTLALHDELMTGQVWRARTRLVEEIRHKHPRGPLVRVARRAMRDSPAWHTYSDPKFDDALPVVDANLILRFFEKAEAALRAKAVDEDLFLDLIGRHAYWWDNVFLPEADGYVRQRLERLGRWTEDRADRLDYWDPTNRGDFPASEQPETVPLDS